MSRYQTGFYIVLIALAFFLGASPAHAGEGVPKDIGALPSFYYLAAPEPWYTVDNFTFISAAGRPGDSAGGPESLQIPAYGTFQNEAAGFYDLAPVWAEPWGDGGTDGGGKTDIAGMEPEAVPEPVSALLTGMAAMWLLGIRRIRYLYYQ